MEHHDHHPFGPFVQKDSKILILGSFPSVKSRETHFYYGHPSNRFWKVLSACYDEEVPISIEQKKQFLTDHQIALWDVIESCEIKGSSDASVRCAVPVDLLSLISESHIEQIVVNGRLAAKLFHQHWPDLNCQQLPSTSAANASMSLHQLTECYKHILQDKT